MITALAASGQLGTGFREESLVSAASHADFIGCDGGSSDPGPYYLGSGESQASSDAMRRDLALILREGRKNGIPVLVGSAGTSGARPHLARTVDIVRALAHENNWHFRLAVVDTEQPSEVVIKALREGRIRPLNNAPTLSEDVIARCAHIVAMGGPQCFTDALNGGADVVIAGRTSDTSIFAAVPIMSGLGYGASYHAAKILECGAGAVEQRTYPDALLAVIDDEGFTVTPPNPQMACTPQSVASHALYESGDPYRIVEPDGVLDLTSAEYAAVDERSVRVTGSQFHPAREYTVRLEGAELLGYRSLIMAGVRDPLLVGQLDRFIDRATGSINHKVCASLSIDEGQYDLRWRIYGKDAVLGPAEPMPQSEGHELGVLITVVAATQKVADAIGAIAWHTALHEPLPEYSGLVSNLAFPFSPPLIPAGPVYGFALNHVMALNEPADAFRMSFEDL